VTDQNDTVSTQPPPPRPEQQPSRWPQANPPVGLNVTEAAVSPTTGPGTQYDADGDETWTEILVRLAQFARHPKLELPGPYGSTAAFIVKMLSIDLVIRVGTIPLVLLGTWLLSGAEYDALSEIDGTPKWALFLLMAVAAPLLEETAMRLQIHRWSEWRFWVSTLGWTAMVLMVAVGTSGLLWLLMIFPATLLAWRLSAQLRSATADSWNANPGRVLWFVTAGFALMHISNYEIPVTNWRLVAAALLVVPQLIGGLLMAYTRVRVGWWGAVVHHGVSNGLLAVIVLPSL